MTATFLGNRVFADVIEFNGVTVDWVGLNPVTEVLRRRKFGHRDMGKKACDNRGKDRRDAAMS